MRIGSLFSGIGGLELGLEWAGLGHTVWQVERDEYCRRVLAKRWPDAERFDDVCTVGQATLAPVDLICGGFPCQDVSSAGKRVGLSGARSGLWFEFRRVVSELRPGWVVVENVASGASKWLDAVREQLGELGYVSLPIPLAASDVGAPHRRGRIFVVAYANGAELRQQPGRGIGTRSARAAKSPVDGSARAHADADQDGQPRSTINAEVAESPQSANTDGKFCKPRTRSARAQCAGRPQPSGGHWKSPQPDFLRVADGVSRGLDSPRRRIQALGNAVVPQCAEVVGWVIRELIETERARQQLAERAGKAEG